ncbi:hypothetical protein GIB67_000630 [Kingdonia uniflora]|uniref:Caffeoyl-CoA O-methyltransferase n=1 Tax=Kingdonia uniflora TaxID=39325 RepID=A0A7J7NCZ6_9MAGN|nr:hypothetical protein GIB67_000630 [Kingdonia uniflora]
MDSEKAHPPKQASTHHGVKNLLYSDALQQYILKTSVYPREHELLRQIREATVAKYDASKSVMYVPPDEGLFLSMLIKILKAKKTLEIGVFTGYSLLTTALALPEDGKVTAIDIDREAYEVGMPFIQKAGVKDKINFIQSDGLSALNNLLKNKHESEFDFVFIDADKANYPNYHELVLKLVKVGGVIAYDNTLLFGLVTLSDDEVPEDFPQHVKDGRKAIVKLNKFLASDSRVEVSQISIGDGLTLCKRLC